MLLEVSEFCRRATRDLPALVDELREETGRYGEQEEAAWTASLGRAAYVLNRPQLKDFHLHVGRRGFVDVEYRLPAASSWCDLVLLGRNESHPQGVIVELKDWLTFGDEPGPSEGLVQHHGQLELHPADQVRGYVEYCRRFHSAVLEWEAEVSGCVFFTQEVDIDAYGRHPHDRLVKEYPLFNDQQRDREGRFPDYLASKLRNPDVDFARGFDRGSYRQDRGFCRQVAEQIADPKSSPFVLLDHQRRALELCRATVAQALERGATSKTVVIIEGPPGSGKSVVAARLWADLQADARLGASDCVVTTTSASQRANWDHLFNQVHRGAAGVILPANQYAPADAKWVGDYKKSHGDGSMKPDAWRGNVKLCRELKGRIGPAAEPLVSIVDEAHALINPESPKARTPAGWPVAFGPQAWHIIRASRVAVFLMDSSQGFRDRETTSREDIERWAQELGAVIAPEVSLRGLQFRAAGSFEYTEWVDQVLGLTEGGRPRSSWRRSKGNPTGSFVFDIVSDPLALDETLRPHIAAGSSARLLAAYGRPWVTQPKAKEGARRVLPHRLAPHEKDFDISFRRKGGQLRWSRIWNYAPKADYTLFVQAPPGSPMASDPLGEVGCPYVVRGFDYDWVGMLWLKDLVWRKDRWIVDIDQVFESGVSGTLAEARRERRAGVEGPGHRALLLGVQRAYRILLTRAMRGIYVWFEDPETAEKVKSELQYD